MPLSFFDAIDILGTFSFAVAGAFAAMEKKLDPFGVLILSFVTAIGGGTLRDILIGHLPVSWLSSTRTIEVILAGSILSLFFGSWLKKLNSLLLIADALGLGLFTMTGLQKGIEAGLTPGICIALGTITGCFGGVLRDVLLNRVPLVFEKEIYASASIVGGVIYFISLQFMLHPYPAYITGILVIFVLRLLAMHFNWSLPKFYERRQKSNERS